jgi:hypothetical protein
MTLSLRTDSHGTVDAGFFSIFTQFSRLGEYTFATRHLCDLARYLAENDTILKTRILGYNLDKFWKRSDDYMQEISQILVEAEQPWVPEELRNFYIDKHLENTQGEVPLEDAFDLNNEGRMIEIKVGDEEESIEIGRYKISALEFGRMSIYLAEGGWVGWINDKEPTFAKPTIEAIKGSKRKFYMEIRNELYYKLKNNLINT